jgi:DNA-binding transcriptional ArsR family regulator
VRPGPLATDASEEIAQRFRALADPTRLRILDLLQRRGETAVGEIAAGISASQQNVSKHLSVLRAERLVARRKLGTSSLYRVADPRAVAWLEDARGAAEPL